VELRQINLVLYITKKLTIKLSETKYVTTFIGTGFQAPSPKMT